MNDVFQYVMPIHFVLVLLFGFVSTFVSLFVLAANYDKPDYSRFSFLTVTIWWFAFLLGISALFWILFASFIPAEMDRTEDYEIRLVTYPDGTKVQMYTFDNRHFNANKEFECQIDEDQVVQRTVYKKVYAGMYYPSPGPEKGAWKLVKKEKK